MTKWTNIEQTTNFFAGGHILDNNYERNIKLGEIGNGQGAGTLVRRRQKFMQSYPPSDNL